MSTAFAEQRETTCHAERKRADTDLKISFWFSVVVLTCLFAGFVSTTARTVWHSFSELTPTWSSKFLSIFTFSWLVFNRRLYLVRSPSQPIFKPESSPYFHLVFEGGHIRFWWFHTCTKNVEPSFFFLVIFNYRSFSPVTGWPTTSALVWLTQVCWLPCRLSVCFFS